MEEQSNNTPAAATPPTEPAAAQETNTPDKKNLTRWAIIVLILALAAAGLWYVYQSQAPGAGNEAANNENAVVATVNGEELTQQKYNQVLAQATNFSMQQGINLQGPAAQEQLQAQAMDALISEELLLQKARAEGFGASDEAVAAQVQQSRSQFPDEATFQSSLEAAGFTEAMLQEQVKEQLTIDSYLEATIDFEGINITDEDVTSFYNEIASSSPDAIPPLEDIRSQVRTSLVQQREQELVGELITQLRNEAEVEILL